MGSEYERDGRWVVSWKDAAGRWREKRTTCRTKAEARRMREDLERQAERQAMGLEPLLQNRGKASFGELMDWWWERHGRRLKSPTIRGFIEKHLRAPLGDVPMLQVTAERFDKLLSDKEGELAPKSLNHLRAITHRMFALASLPGVGLWSGPNPIAAVPRRKVPKRLPEYLRWHEAPEVLDELAAPWRQVVAVAVYTALRKGEIFGLERQDVDLASGELRVRRSWDSDTVKDNEAVILPIARGLRPHLEEALAASKRGTLLFARPDCSMYPKDVAADEILRRAMARAGIVVGYEHRCRRKGCGFREMRASPDTDGCPKCRMLLWAKPIPRHVRFHDLRHTTATLLLKDGVSLATVQKVLRHSDPELTTAIYGHLDIADTRAALDRLTFEETDADRPSAPDGAPVARLRGIRKDEGRDGIGIPSDVAAFDESGRQDLNLRPLGPELLAGASDTVGSGPMATDVNETTEARGSCRSDTDRLRRPRPAASVTFQAQRTLGTDRLLTVRQVAERLQVCRATVYRLVARGQLPAVRVSSGAIRVRDSGLLGQGK